MVKFVKISKDGKVQEEQVSKLEELYKKCNLRKPEGFNKITEFIDNCVNIELWGRTSGRINIKNVYTFPESVNSNIYGTCGIVSLTNNKLVDLEIAHWEEICEKLCANVDECEDNDSIINKPDDDKVSELASEVASVSASSEYIDSELKEDDYLYSSEEEEEDEDEEEEEDN